MKKKILLFSGFAVFVIFIGLVSFKKINSDENDSLLELEKNFKVPPDEVKPGVYWYFLDGWVIPEEMTKDLESMKQVGITDVVFLEIDQRTPRGNMVFFSQEWQNSFKRMVHETERLGINITLGVGPGWSGSGGPWVPANESMRNLIYSSTDVIGNSKIQTIQIQKPQLQKPFFGERVYTPDLKKLATDYYEDVFVLAYPKPEGEEKMDDIVNKAIYQRAPYSSSVVKPYYPVSPDDKTNLNSAVSTKKVINLTSLLQKDGTIKWEVPDGKWTILRMGMSNNGAVTRPAPLAGIGFESDKFSKQAFKNHYDFFIGKLINQSGISKQKQGGIKTLHMDSWEMGAQNWTLNFEKEFQKRRGYDPTMYLPTFTGQIINNRQISERFLWDIRKTSQDLVLENHAEYIKTLAHENGLTLSIEPYDMNPLNDIDLGAVADIPMCEFWNKDKGFNTQFSCIEATSIAHILGKPEVRAESFTSNWGTDAYTSYPTVMKNQTDWALATGINKFFYHTFAHKAYGDQFKPGMSMGGYGVNWDRGQTWWSMSSAYHNYVSRCSYILHQGRTVADILYLTQENSPVVFETPATALEGDPLIADRKGYNFDACSPNLLISLATVKDGKVVFPSGASYNILVLPDSKSMTPELLNKISNLVKGGATIIGCPPKFSPSLSNYPNCDKEVNKFATEIWNGTKTVGQKKFVGKGEVYFWDYELSISRDTKSEIYPNYNFVANILNQKKIAPDFFSNSSIRYTHKETDYANIYFVSNRSEKRELALCSFRVDDVNAEIWNPVTGESFSLVKCEKNNNRAEVEIEFDAFQSYFVIFPKVSRQKKLESIVFPENNSNTVKIIDTPWNVSFDTKWGGKENVVFDKLIDWTESKDIGIKYYSGVAVYSNKFSLSENIDIKKTKLFLDLGIVKNMAQVFINGKDAGIVWTSPWKVKINDFVKTGTNLIEIKVANLWSNRLIGDEQLPEDGIKDGKFPDWFYGKSKRTSGRYTFSTFKYYKKDSPLQPSGLLGTVKITSTK